MTNEIDPLVTAVAMLRERVNIMSERLTIANDRITILNKRIDKLTDYVYASTTPATQQATVGNDPTDQRSWIRDGLKSSQ